ncbi:MAG: isoprenylcysteine carboxylmethyltransferase family protein [Ekhidna sp.]
MKLKVPPVALVFVTGGIIWVIDKITDLTYSFEGKEWLDKGLLFLCVLVLVFALAAFRKLKTTVDPMNPSKATKLVTIGIYHVTRNPMYLSMLLLLAGFASKLGNPLCLIPVILFVWYMNQFQIKPEEEALQEIFGEDYTNYCKKVRRWI